MSVLLKEVSMEPCADMQHAGWTTVQCNLNWNDAFAIGRGNSGISL